MSKTIRILTYNVHSCIGTDRKVDPDRIASVIAQVDPDVVALQEVDVGRRRTAGVDQAHLIASLLRMKAHFHPTLTIAEEHYGDAILTAQPIAAVKAGPLPSIGELRGAISVEIFFGSARLRVINTHLGLRGRDRVRQMTILLGNGWLNAPVDTNTETILCGDFNAIPSSGAYRLASRTLRDAQVLSGMPRATFPSRYPFMRLDHIFVTNGILVERTRVLDDRLARISSDHLPVLAEIRLPDARD